MEGQEDMGNQSIDESLAYVKYSAKELLFLQGQKLDNLTQSINDMSRDMVNRREFDELEDEVTNIKLSMVHKNEMQITRRWTASIAVAAAAALAGVARALGY